MPAEILRGLAGTRHRAALAILVASRSGSSTGYTVSLQRGWQPCEPGISVPPPTAGVLHGSDAHRHPVTRGRVRPGRSRGDRHRTGWSVRRQRRARAGHQPRRHPAGHGRPACADAPVRGAAGARRGRARCAAGPAVRPGQQGLPPLPVGGGLHRPVRPHRGRLRRRGRLLPQPGPDGARRCRQPLPAADRCAGGRHRARVPRVAVPIPPPHPEPRLHRAGPRAGGGYRHPAAGGLRPVGCGAAPAAPRASAGRRRGSAYHRQRPQPCVPGQRHAGRLLRVRGADRRRPVRRADGAGGLEPGQRADLLHPGRPDAEHHPDHCRDRQREAELHRQMR